MVRVPLPQVSEQAGGSNGFVAPGVVAQGNATGAQLERLGEAVARTGFSTAGLAAEQEERLHVAAVKEAQALAEEKILASDRQYRNTLGKAATGKGREQAWQDLKRDLTGIENGLESETERRLFLQVAERRLLDVRASWNTHEDRQIRAYELGAGEAVLQAKAEAARQQLVDRAQEPPERPQEPRKKTQAKAPSNIGEGIVAAYQAAAAQHGGAPTAAPPTKAQDPLLPVRAEAESLAAKKGMSPEEAKLYVRDQLTQVHAGVVADLVEAGRTTEARTYFGRVRKEIDPDSGLELEGLVHRASVGDDGAQLAIQIRDRLQAGYREQRRLLETSSEPGQDLTQPLQPSTLPAELPPNALQAAGFEEIQALYEKGDITLEVADTAKARISKLAQEEQAKTAAMADFVARQAEQYLGDHKYESVEQLPPTIYQQAKALGILPDLREYSASAKRYGTSDQRLFADLRSPGGNGHFAKPMREFDTEMRRKLIPHDHAIAMALWREANDQATPEDFSFLTPLRRLEDAARGLNIDPQKNLEEFNAFRREVESRVNAWQYATGKKIAQDPQQLDTIFQQITEDRAFIPQSFIFDVLNPDDALPFALMTPEQRRTAYVLVGGEQVRLRHIPQEYTAIALEQIAAINQERAARGKTPLPATKQLIAELWVAARGTAK